MQCGSCQIVKFLLWSMSNTQDHCKMEIPGPSSLFLQFNYAHSLTLAVPGRKSQMLEPTYEQLWRGCSQTDDDELAKKGTLRPKRDQIHSHKAPKAFISHWILLSTFESYAWNGSYQALFWTSEFLFITSVFTPSCLLCKDRRFNSSMGACLGMKALRLEREKCRLRSRAGCFQNNPRYEIILSCKKPKDR